MHGDLPPDLRLIMTDLFGWLRTLPEPLLLLVVGCMITAESGLLIGLVLPGTTAVLTLGVLARGGFVHPGLAVTTAAVAAVTGTQLAYLRGRRRALPLPARCQRVQQQAVDLLHRAGVMTLCATQWLAGLRTITPRLAARAGIGYRRFAAVSIPTSAIWGSTLVVLSYLAGWAYQQVSSWFGLGGTGVVVAVLVAGWAVGRARRRVGRSGDGRPARG